MVEYNYEVVKPELLTDKGQRLLLQVRDRAISFCDVSGAFTAVSVTNGIPGDQWLMMACIDRLIELGEFEYINPEESFFPQRVLRRVR